VDWKSNLVMVGALFGTVDFAGTPLTSAGLEDVYLTKLAADGTPLWSQRFGDAAAQLGTSVTLDPERNITIVGTYEGSPDFGDGALPSQASAGTFMVRFAP